MKMTSLYEQQQEEKRPTTIGMAWNRVWEKVRPSCQANSGGNKIIGKNKHGRNNVHEIVAYLKTCGMDPEKVEIRRSTLGGVHVTFYFDDDTTTSSDSSSVSGRSQDDPVLYNSKGQERSTSMKRQKAQALIGIDIQDRLLREWAK